MVIDRTSTEEAIEFSNQAARLAREVAASLSTWPLSWTQAQVILTMARWTEPQKIVTLTRSIEIQSQTLTDVLDGLERRGWIQRGNDPTDRRIRAISLTDAGRGLDIAIRDEVEATAAAFFERERADR